MKKFALAAATLVALSAPVAAASLMIDPALTSPAPMSTDWTGFYAGVVAGYGFGNTNYTLAGTTTGIPIGGALGGATAGYNQQFQQFVLGGEADFAWSGVTGSKVVTGTKVASNLGWQGTIRGRAGVVFDPVPVMAYATAGLAVGGLTTTLDTAGAKPYSGTQVGWTAGVGIEGKVSDQMTLKAEYAYADLGTATVPANSFLTGFPGGKSHVTEQTFKLGANWHF